MQRRNTLLAASALLLNGFTACTYNRSVHPDKLECRDDNGCPSGYRCVGVTVEIDGFCCNNPDPTLCVRPPQSPTDARAAAGDARLTGGSSDGIPRTDGSGGQDLNGASDASAEKPASDVNTTDRAAPPDSGPPGFDAAADLSTAQVDGTTNFDAAQPDLAGATIQPDAQLLLDALSDTPVLLPSDALVLLPPDALIQPDTAALPEALAPIDTAPAQDGSPDVPVAPLPDAASDLSSDTPMGAGPQITSIEGTGAAAAVAPRTEDLAAWNARAADRLPASHRISSANPELVVTGTALDDVTLATLKGQSGQGNHDMTIEEKTMTTLRLRWPSTLTAGGLFILSLTAAAGTADAQVFFLQGEKGDKGDQGNKGDQGSQGAPGDSLFSCAGNDCSTTKNVLVSGLLTASTGIQVNTQGYSGPTLSHLSFVSGVAYGFIQSVSQSMGNGVAWDSGFSYGGSGLIGFVIIGGGNNTVGEFKVDSGGNVTILNDADGYLTVGDSPVANRYGLYGYGGSLFIKHNFIGSRFFAVYVFGQTG